LDKEKATAVLRAQIILTTTPAPGDASWREPLLRAVPDLFIEGRLGPMVTALVRVDQIKALAGVPSVSTVRIPRPARVDVDPALPIKGDSDRALKQSGLEALHALDKSLFSPLQPLTGRGFRGQGVRIALVDSDFRGYEDMIAAGRLPARTRLVDLTT